MRVTHEHISDEDLSAKLVTYMKRHGPSRTRSMTKSLRVPYERSVLILQAALAAGDVEQVPDGLHRGIAVLAWCMRGDTRAKQNERTRLSFGGADVLLAMQAAARATLMQGGAYT
ncbi:hypothetical protein PQR05_29260 [Paraburkholderia sediminicola]|uniref:hypothetical protein n=1 Tax=Paraburkholderia sediminicola TaxID=458836 RepID=UPI0038B9C69D